LFVLLTLALRVSRDDVTAARSGEIEEILRLLPGPVFVAFLVDLLTPFSLLSTSSSNAASILGGGM
jgi:hypothetical protein